MILRYEIRTSKEMSTLPMDIYFYYDDSDRIERIVNKFYGDDIKMNYLNDLIRKIDIYSYEKKIKKTFIFKYKDISDKE